MWQAARVTELARAPHGLGRAAGPLGAGRLRVEPEPERDADRMRPGLEECHGAVDAAAHRDCDPLGVRRRAESERDRVGERVGGERLAGDGRGLEQGQAAERLCQPVRVSVDDAIAVYPQSHEREIGAAGGISDELPHRRRVAVPCRASAAARVAVAHGYTCASSEAWSPWSTWIPMGHFDAAATRRADVRPAAPRAAARHKHETAPEPGRYDGPTRRCASPVLIT